MSAIDVAQRVFGGGRAPAIVAGVVDGAAKGGLAGTALAGTIFTGLIQETRFAARPTMLRDMAAITAATTGAGTVLGGIVGGIRSALRSTV